MLNRSLPRVGTKLGPATPREDVRFVQLQLCVVLNSGASMDHESETYRTIVVSGASTLLETAQAIVQSFGLEDATTDSNQIRCIYEDILVEADGVTVENAEIPGLEWRAHPKRVFHTAAQLKAVKIAALLDRPLFGRPRGERKKGGSRSRCSLLCKVEDASNDAANATPRPRNGLYAFTICALAAGYKADQRAKCQAALPRCVAGDGAALGGNRIDYQDEAQSDPTQIDAVNKAFFQAAKAGAKNAKMITEDFDDVKPHLRAPLFTLNLAEEFAAKNDL